jgi:hypothetical protein
LYSSPDIIREIKLRIMTLAGHITSMGEMRNTYKKLAGKPETNRVFGRPRPRWKNSITMT